MLLIAVCFVASCSQWDTPYDSLNKDGYNVSVRFDANGGMFAETPNVYVVDVFNLDSLKTNANGNKEISLLDPEDSKRGTIKYTVSNQGHNFVGWYTERTPRVDENGNPLIKEWYDVTAEDQKNMIANVEWCPADIGYFRGGGFSSRFITKAEVPCTMIRLNLVKGLGPVLQIAEGWTIELPDDVSDTIWKRTDYTWPCTWFAPRCDGVSGSPFENAYSVMNTWGANHGAISYGHVGADLITLCSMLRIPVCMHNVPAKDIFRPSAWNAFGQDKEGQDYRACATYGPLFKK